MKGFTLIELMVAMLVVAVLAAIALPSYRGYVLKSDVRAAQSNLLSLSAAMDNMLQLQLSYPEASTSTTAETKELVKVWAPSDNKFVYTVESEGDSYTLTATGTGAVSSCSLTIDHSGNRTIGDSSCPVSSW